MNKIEPHDIRIHFELPPETFDFEVVAIDTEWFGQSLDNLHRPHGFFGCIGCTNNGTDVYMIFDTSQIQEFYDRIDASMHVYHNAKYDIKQLRRYANLPDRAMIWDIMLVEQVRYSGYYHKFALNDLARRYLQIYMSKEVRESFSDGDENSKMTDEQIFYAAVDIICTWMVGKAQISEIDEEDLNVWNKIEKPFLWTLLDTKGIYFNSEKWTIRYEIDAKRAKEIDEQLPFNPRSPKQIKEFFKERYGISLPSTGESILTALFEDHPEIPELQAIMEGRSATKAASTYGIGWVNAVEEDGRVYPAWKQIGAETGRMSAGSSAGVAKSKGSKSSLAIQTIPHDISYRECFTASPDHTLVIADYASQEPKELAYISGDPELIQIFRDKKDVYIEVGYRIFNERFDKKDPRRQQMKSIILGVSYGLSKVGLANKLGITEDEAENMLNEFYKKFPAVKKWVTECAVWKPFATTILGRKFWGNPYVDGWQRNYQNFPMQGSAVDCTKMAASKIRKVMGYNPCEIYMHDELLCEFPNEDLEKGKKVVEDVMVERQEWMADGLVPGGVELFVGANWGVKQ